MAPLSISLFGPFHVLLDGEPVTHFEYDKVRALLAFLAIESDRPHRREFLAGLLWPEQPEAAAFQSLRQALSRLRHAINDSSAQPPFLHVRRDSIQFNLSSHVSVDVIRFTNLINASHSHRHRNPRSCQTCAHGMRAAAALYQGDFLDHFSLDGCLDFESWALVQRQRLRNQVIEVLASLTDHDIHRKEYKQARASALRQIEIDPLLESAYRQIMTCCALSGQRSQALSYYESCRCTLDAELGVAPDEETEKLHRLIQVGILKKQRGATHSEHGSLPLPPSPFFGRVRELSDLTAAIEDPDVHLISLVGPGGVGKTSLALKIAADSHQQFSTGAVFVSLAQLSSPEKIYPALAAALNLSLEGKLELKTQLLNYLRQREMLIIMDNFEHLLPHGVDPINEILEHARQVVLVVTTMERLNLRAETILPVAGLEYPPSPSIHSPENYSAVALFLQAARRGGISLDEIDLSAVKQLCRLVSGNPLALELAASLLTSISCRELVTELENSPDLLTTSRRDASERHQSIRALFDYSWKLLTDSERSAFRRLSVFRGGFSRKSAMFVVGASLPMLSALIDKSLLLMDPITGRYKTHGLLEKYAREKLDQAGETRQILERHLDFYLSFAEQTSEGLNRAQAEWLVAADRELENLQAALETALSSGEAGSAPALRLCGALGRYWVLRGRWAEGQKWLTRALEAVQPGFPIPSDDAIRALYWASILAIYKGETLLAEAWTEKALAVSQEGASPFSQALVAELMGNLKRNEGDNDSAQACHESSLDQFRSLDDPWGMCVSLNNLFRLAYRSNNYGQATQLAEESMKLAHETGDRWNMSLALDYLGIIAHDQGEYEKGSAYLEESLSISNSLGSRFMEAHAIYWLGRVARSQGNPAPAIHRFEESMAMYYELDSFWGQAVNLQGLGLVALDEGDLQRAEQLLAESCNLVGAIGDQQLIAFVQICQGDVACATGEYERATDLYANSLEILRHIRDRWLVALTFSGMAVLAVQQDDYDRGAYLFATEDDLRQVIGTPRSPAEQALASPSRQRLEQALTGTRRRAEYEAGRAFASGDLSKMIDYAYFHGAYRKQGLAIPWGSKTQTQS